VARTAAVTLTGSSVLSNAAGVGGGGAYNAVGMLRLVDTTVTGNTANTSIGGGGVYNFLGTVSLSGTSITGNQPNDVMEVLVD
jgi:hypothetical protein